MKLSTIAKCGVVCVGLTALFYSVGCSSSKAPEGAPQSQNQPPTQSQTPQKRALTVFSQEITSPVHEIAMKAGSAYNLNVTVKNTGIEPWTQQTAAEPLAVNVGYRWVDKAGTILPLEGTRTYLSRPVVAPGESDNLKLVIVAQPKPGKYTLWVSMVQEGVAWFFQEKAKPLMLAVTIT